MPKRPGDGDVSSMPGLSETRAPNERRVLLQAIGMTVIDFRCRAGVEPEGPEELNPTHSIVFVRRGVFRRTHERQALVADVNQVLFFNKAEPYRFSHPFAGGDDCTILAPQTRVARELVARHSPRDADRSPPRRRSGSATA